MRVRSVLSFFIAAILSSSFAFAGTPSPDSTGYLQMLLSQIKPGTPYNWVVTLLSIPVVLGFLAACWYGLGRLTWAANKLDREHKGAAYRIPLLGLSVGGTAFAGVLAGEFAPYLAFGLSVVSFYILADLAEMYPEIDAKVWAFCCGPIPQPVVGTFGFAAYLTGLAAYYPAAPLGFVAVVSVSVFLTALAYYTIGRTWKRKAHKDQLPVKGVTAYGRRRFSIVCGQVATVGLWFLVSDGYPYASWLTQAVLAYVAIAIGACWVAGSLDIWHGMRRIRVPQSGVQRLQWWAYLLTLPVIAVGLALAGYGLAGGLAGVMAIVVLMVWSNR